jgi:arsenate reductase-like glutaredoxin family protein
MSVPSETRIYHNPNCGTSRKVLGMLRDAGSSRPSSNT